MAAFWRPGHLQAAARSLLGGSSVVIATGFPVLAASGGLAPETDGPDASLALGEALVGLGLAVRYLTDPISGPLLEAIGAEPLDQVEWDASNADAQARSYLADHEPSHLVAVERPGRAADGRYYTMRGRDISASVAAIDELFEVARGSLITTIGIGDGGNEVGMGGLAVGDAVEHGAQIASVIATDLTVVSGVSTWGAYGLVGALSRAAGRNLLPSRAQVVARVEAIVERGAVDGVSGQAVPKIDGLELEVTLELLDAIAAGLEA